MGELTTDSTPGGSTPALLRRPRRRARPPPPRDRMPPVLRGASAQPGLVGRRDPRIRDWSGSASPVTTCRRSSSSGTTWLASAWGSSIQAPRS